MGSRSSQKPRQAYDARRGGDDDDPRPTTGGTRRQRSTGDEEQSHEASLRPSDTAAGDFAFAEGRITARGGDYVYAGIGLIHRDLFNGSPSGPFSVRDLFFDAVAQNKVGAQVHTGQWTDIGTPNDYQSIRQVNS